MKTLILITLLTATVSMAYVAYLLYNLDNSAIIHRYLDNQCEMLASQDMSQVWYECDKRDN